ncbi:MAG: PAN domain-containing protein [Filomicrobium sp.]
MQITIIHRLLCSGVLAIIAISAPISSGAQSGSSFEPTTDRPGGGYRNFWIDRADARICRDACAAEQRCKAWTFVNPRAQGPKARCWLKDRVPPAKSSTCCISGVMDTGSGGGTTGGVRPGWIDPGFPGSGGRGATGGGTGSGGGPTDGGAVGGGGTIGSSFEPTTDRPGGNYRNFWIDRADARICRDACAAEQRCKAWTFVNPRAQGPKARCWLKDRVPPAKSSTCCISGVMGTAGASTAGGGGMPGGGSVVPPGGGAGGGTGVGSLPGPPPGWIRTDGRQDCISGGFTQSGGLSCVAPASIPDQGLCADPRTQSVIDSWLSLTIPWVGAQLDCWGRWYGRSQDGGAVTRNNCQQPETDGRSRCQYLLDHLSNNGSDQLGRTLLDYVRENVN